MYIDAHQHHWLLAKALAPVVAAMLAHDLVFDALMLESHLGPLEAFARRHPDLPIVVDHAAKPRIADGPYRDWRRSMERLAALDNVCCKLSDLLAEASEQRPQALRPYAETVLDLFGSERVIWGSDWPVVNLAQGYLAWLHQCLHIVPADHAAVFGRNAGRFYRLQGASRCREVSLISANTPKNDR